MGLTAGFPFADLVISRSDSTPDATIQAADHNQFAALITILKNELAAVETTVDLGSFSTVSDTSTSVTNVVRVVAYTALTVARSVTLPLASTCVAGRRLTIVDFSGSASSTKTLTAARSGSDLIEGAFTHLAVNVAYGARTYMPDGVSKWVAIS